MTGLSRLAATLGLALLLFSLAPAHAQAPWQSLPVPPPLPALATQGHVDRDGARIWYGMVGKGLPVVLLHGGMASADSWGFEVAPLVRAGHRVILIDSRGQGRSSMPAGALHYAAMASDVIAVLDRLHVRRADIVGWSDGAIVSLIIAIEHPERLRHVFAFGANMDLTGFNPDADKSPMIPRIDAALRASFAHVAPGRDYDAMARAVFAMQGSEPTYSAAQLAAIRGPRILIADGEHEEFIARSHTDYLAKTIPGARLLILPGVSHFAPWQRPEAFTRAVLDFLQRP